MKRQTIEEAEEAENAKDRARHEHQEALSDLADKYIDEAMRRGEVYTEGLCNWAIDRALEEIGGVP
jgi:hypothetical protein